MRNLFQWICIFVVLSVKAVTAQSALVVGALDGGAAVSYTLEELLALNQATVITSNEFVDGSRKFQGPLVRDLLDPAFATSLKSVILTAANDYQVTFPIQEFFDYDVILALNMDGKPLSRRDKGPIWVIYPMSDFAVLRDPVYNSRLIWQLVKMEFQ